ncbi:unnamed protein product [Parajaminaea phylloscopi]
MEDAFQVRLDFTSLLRRLNASQQSILKVLLFADRHAARSASDIWDCIVSECSKASLSSRLNILFMLDFLFTEYALSASSSGSTAGSRQRLLSSFKSLAQRGLVQIIDAVVPADSWQGVKLNSGVTSQILQSWRIKRIFHQDQLSELLDTLEERRKGISRAATDASSTQNAESGPSSLTKDEIIRRIEEDRERHKSIREKLWVLPPKSYVDVIPEQAVTGNSSASSAGPTPQAAATPSSERPHKKPRLSAATPSSSGMDSAQDAPQSAPTPSMEEVDDIQFQELWETTSDLNEDDLEAWREEEERWWGSEKLLRSRKTELEKIRLDEEKRGQRVSGMNPTAGLSPSKEQRRERHRADEEQERKQGSDRSDRGVGTANASQPRRDRETRPENGRHDSGYPRPSTAASSNSVGGSGRQHRRDNSSWGPRSSEREPSTASNGGWKRRPMPGGPGAQQQAPSHAFRHGHVSRYSEGDSARRRW